MHDFGIFNMAHADHFFFQAGDRHVFSEIDFNLCDGKQFLAGSSGLFADLFLLPVLVYHNRRIGAHAMKVQKLIETVSIERIDFSCLVLRHMPMPHVFSDNRSILAFNQGIVVASA